MDEHNEPPSGNDNKPPKSDLRRRKNKDIKSMPVADNLIDFAEAAGMRPNTQPQAGRGGTRRGKPNPNTSPRRVEQRQRMRRAFEMRAQGMSLNDIADALGYANASGAYNAIMTMMKATPADGAEEVRAMELARLDQQLERLYKTQEALQDKLEKSISACEVMIKSFEAFVRLSKRRSEITGIDAPLRLRWDEMRSEADRARGLLIAAGVPEGQLPETDELIALAEKIALGQV